ncbi:ataxin-7-like protein 1 isoform X2 [Bacillus rossius redtenbacheri]|uniref:ataxin-7-like protein 1 isoform X2 n=1 Tax=Bacillus rossius redtenbacheri TaxID=93214 RepID=UPI002FDE1333
MEARGDRDDIVMLSKSSSEIELPEENGIIDVENDASVKIERTEASSSANPVADELAADDIQNFIGQPWTNWEAAMCRSPLTPEVPSKVYESDCTTLSFEDKRWAGEIPGIEPFIAHVCSLCKATVKPGFLTQHYALWHNVKPDDPLPNFEELKKDPLNTTLRTHRISPDCKLILGLPKVKIKKQKQAKSASNTQNVIGGGNTGILPSPKAGPAVISASSTNKSTNKTFSNSLDVRQETVPNISVSLPLALPLSVPMKPVVTDSSFTKLTKTSKITTSSIDLGVFLPTLPASSDPPAASVVPVPVATHVSALSQPLASPPPKKRSKTERKYLPVKDREYNPDKHCGVWNLETSKHCTRSLTCNCHSLSQRRAVTGRSKTFDNLLADHRAAKETLLLAAKPNVIQVTQQEKQGKCPASILKSSSLLKQDVLPTHNFHVVTSGSAVTSVLSHRQKPTALPSLYFPASSSQLLSVNALERTIKSLTPAVIGQVTLAKFPPCKSDSAELTGKTDTVVRTKIDHLPADISWVKRHPKPVAVRTSQQPGQGGSWPVLRTSLRGRQANFRILDNLHQRSPATASLGKQGLDGRCCLQWRLSERSPGDPPSVEASVRPYWT